MRIISGTAGGIPLSVPRSVLRPTADRVREAVFSILANRVPGAAVLDLFAGSGAYGLECLSRGAARSVFVDDECAACHVIRQNLTQTKLAGGHVVCAPAESWLKRTGADRFDLVFADPPYAKQPSDRDWPAWLLTLEPLSACLNDDGLFVLECFAKSTPPVPANSPWALDDDRRYGDTRVLFLSRRHADEREKT